MTKCTISIGLCLLVITAGCMVERTPTWNLSVSGYEEPTDGHYTFTGDISLGGNVNSVAVYDVAVIFVGQDGSTLSRIHVGDLNESRYIVKLNDSFEQPIDSVVLSIGRIESRENADCSFEGLRKTQGTLSPAPLSELPNSGEIPSHPCTRN